MDGTTAPMEWLDDLTVELTERDVMLDLDPAILLWEQALASAA